MIRQLTLAEDPAFLLPVVIDGTPDASCARPNDRLGENYAIASRGR